MSPGQRAAAELARDPRRTDAAIAAAARCTPRTVLRVRRVLERRGAIDPVPLVIRAGRTRPSRNPGAGERAAEQLALDPDRANTAIARAARCSDRTVLEARRGRVHTGGMGKAGYRGTADDPHAPVASQEAATRTPPRYSPPPDAIEDTCAGCTLIWELGRWVHDRACIFRRPAREPG